jgi:hypothetical protein
MPPSTVSGAAYRQNPAASTSASRGALIGAGLLSWMTIALGFFGLHMLMQERPEFVGEPLTSAKADLLQESPRIVIRKLSDDISVIKAVQPESSDVTFTMRGRRDYRGLRTIMDMSGDFHARYSLTNAFDEPVFVLFKCPHPRSARDSGHELLAGGLKLQASLPGSQENAKDAWFWSGSIEARSTMTIDISYHATALERVTYRIDGEGTEPVKHLRVTVQRQDLDSLRFESGEGPVSSAGSDVIWERKDFLVPESFSARIVESRNLYGSLLQLLEIGPVICALFLLAATAVVLGRQPLSALQLITIAAGYAFYFPLMVYLSSRFSFKVALTIAALVPGALLVNYCRLLLGVRVGFFGGIIFLLLYQIFPTLAAFAGWNRGMVLLCLGVVTFAVLINLQNQALRKQAAAAGVIAFAAVNPTMCAAEVQVIVPGQLVSENREPKAPAAALISFEPATYEVRHEAAYFLVEAKLPFEILRTGDEPTPLFAKPLHLQQRRIEAASPETAQLVTTANRVALLARQPGSGVAHFTYRVAIQNHEGRKRAEVPLLAAPSGDVRIESPLGYLANVTGTRWNQSTHDKLTVYEIGVAGEETLIVEWPEEGAATEAPAPDAAREFYGIGITRGQHLTVINSDGSCTHFAEFELPASANEELRLQLPKEARLISMSIDGVETAAPALENGLCRIRLSAREAPRTPRRLSCRLAYHPVRLGFVGEIDLALPEVFQTVGTLEWVVALPAGFETQVISSGLEVQKTPPDLERFGEYGRILKSYPQRFLAKTLAPPGPVGLNLRYRQLVPGLTDH